MLNNAPTGGVIPAALHFPSLPHPPSQPTPAPTAAPTDNSGSQCQGRDEDEATKARREAWKTYYAQVAKLQADRLAAATAAMTAETGLGTAASVVLDSSSHQRRALHLP